jgi:hypothetical protein
LFGARSCPAVNNTCCNCLTALAPLHSDADAIRNCVTLRGQLLQH